MTATTIRVQMAQRKDTAANWTAANPILLSGEIGYETDTKKFKIGDGSTNWNTLAYLPIPDGSGNLTITGNLEIGTTGSLTFEGSTANGFETTLAVTDPTADRTITLPNVSGTVVTTGDTGSVTSTMLLDGTIVNADISDIAEIAVSKLANGTANQVIVTDGTNVSWSDNLTLAGDLIVNGTTTTINTQELLVEDKNIIIGNVTSPTDVTADGGGITLKGTTDKTINWVDSTDAWTSSERFSYPLGSATAPALTFTGDPNTGIYSPGADQVAISTNGVQRINIEADGDINIDSGGVFYDASSGRFLVGTSSGSGNNYLQIQGDAGGATGTGGISLRRNVAPSGMGEGSTMGIIDFGPNDGGVGARIEGVADAQQGTNDYPGRLVFSTCSDASASPSERMRINSAGYTKFGTSGSYEGGNIYEFNGGENTGACLVVRWTPSGINSGNGFIVKTPNTAAATTHNLIAADASAGNVFKVRADGNVYNTNGVYGSISDVKLKENIVDAASQWDDIKALQVRKYNFKAGLTHTQIGVIAQEVEQVSPGLVYETLDRDEDGNETGEVTKGVNYSVLYMKAVKALQEAMERIETLEAKVAALEAQ
jgi:hypothetical protein